MTTAQVPPNLTQGHFWMGSKKGAANGGANGSSQDVDTPKFLPPNMTQASFDKFAKKVIDVVGEDNFQVITPEMDLDGYEDDDFGRNCRTHDYYRSFDDEQELVGSALCHPRTVQDIQAILAAANEHKMPLWPISTGRNLAYGGSAPRVPGSLVMVLSTHMNRILHVDTTACVCIVEPGVTFMQMSDYLKEHNLIDRIRVDSSGLGWGSMIGNALDRGGGASLYGDRWGKHSGMEVVLPNGEVVRMGMGAVQSPEGRKQAAEGVHPADQALNECFALFPYGWGPMNDGIFSQGNSGIVTKMGFWLMPAPQGMTPFSITFEKESDLKALVDCIQPLDLNGTLQSSVSLRNLTLEAAHYGPRSSYTNASHKEVIPEEDFEKMAKKLNTGRWRYIGAVFGSDKVREALIEDIKREMTKVPGSKWATLDENPDEQNLVRVRATYLQGISSMGEFAWMKQWLPNCSVIMVAAISRLEGSAVWDQYSRAKELFAKAGIDYISHYVAYFRTMHNVCIIPYDRKDKDMRGRAQWLARTLLKEWKENGWSVFRTHVGLMDQVADTYDFNKGALWKMHEEIHDNLDPNGILAPGRGGVWPKSYNKDEWMMGKKYIG
ncbi:Vanillyl-alcohol oxidase [Colletotrichum fructicola]|uniref:FAD binding domain-containing protein n=3 Tax=Colletotrichum gloeosporioides species complex TaxID=2707338 RepID=T0LQL6_COLGC|nr:Vanillyl-alcohol oxidase [Colletotrichum gloeosporioides]EQB50500.1 FAD binding domain-containing protein [Colletotrichum gloeosporioides Cg-14]KAF4822714.1 Vanillyl-alcohol oxidase [Colletotrichum siamense]KAF4829381.1 Vanillyl-alcohol oxidase [Colletotrichum tropicale]KAF4909226.1 Vanillyl-alcohol oxidase [Colletotrichum fructicola]KAI8215653.1 Vanillyl-alcohol oxidase [Colletotrichum sp. SAR 10_76]KAI8224678.1 Vanillyl-alcohol oxidase [Colletotrichum sp. SAR 10_86]KAI8270862.1 Vanillyl